MVSTLDSGSSSLGSSPGLGHCVILGKDTLISQCLSPPILVPRSSVSFGHMVGETEALVSDVTGCPKICQTSIH